MCARRCLRAMGGVMTAAVSAAIEEGKSERASERARELAREREARPGVPLVWFRRRPRLLGLRLPFVSFRVRAGYATAPTGDPQTPSPSPRARRPAHRVDPRGPHGRLLTCQAGRLGPAPPPNPATRLCVRGKCTASQAGAAPARPGTHGLASARPARQLRRPAAAAPAPAP